MVRDEEEIRFVIDTNILISALIRDDSLTSKLLRSNACIFFYPWDGLKEIEFYREYIISKRGKHLQAYSFQHALEFVLESVFIVPSEMYSSKIGEAFDIMRERDPKDTPFLALALQLICPLWSNDRHFQGLSQINVYDTKSLVELLKERGAWW